MSYECACDYDPATVYSSAVRTARKPHRCEECGSKIEPGGKYEYVFGIWEGDVSIFKTCEACLDLRQWVKNNVPCFCWAHGNMLEDARETIEEACFRAPLETAGLRFGFLRRKIEAKRRHAHQ